MKYLFLLILTSCALPKTTTLSYEKKTMTKCGQQVEYLADLKGTWHAKDFEPVCKLTVEGFRGHFNNVWRSKHDHTCGFFYPGHFVTFDDKEMKLDKHEYLDCF